MQHCASVRTIRALSRTYPLVSSTVPGSRVSNREEVSTDLLRQPREMRTCPARGIQAGRAVYAGRRVLHLARVEQRGAAPLKCFSQLNPSKKIAASFACRSLHNQEGATGHKRPMQDAVNGVNTEEQDASMHGRSEQVAGAPNGSTVEEHEERAYEEAVQAVAEGNQIPSVVAKILFGNAPKAPVAGTASSGPDEVQAEAAEAALPDEAKAKRVKEALAAGKLGFGLSAGGFLYCYHLGVMWELEKLGVLCRGMLMAGASAGSLAIATYNSGIQEGDATRALKDFAADCRAGGTPYRLSGLLKEFLHSYLPPDAHERCSGVCHVAITRVFPVWHPEIISHFEDKDHLVDALLTSCHVPVYANGNLATKFRGKYYIDGCMTNFIPSPPTETVVKICCFPISKTLVRTQPAWQMSKRLTPILDIAISPDAYQPFPHSYQTLLTWAVMPAADEVLDWLVDRGRSDARAWAEAMDLTAAASIVTPAGARPALGGVSAANAGNP